MNMCLDCYFIFENPKVYNESHGFLHPPYEIFEGCPICGGMYDEAVKCSHCYDFIKSNYIKLLNGEDVCENCFTQKKIGSGLY